MDKYGIITLVAAVLFILTGLLLALCFEYMKSQRDLYSPKLRLKRDRVPVPYTMGFMTWIPHTISISDKELLILVGMDAYIFLRYIRLLCKVMITCSAVSLLILLPIYRVSWDLTKLSPLTFTMFSAGSPSKALWAPFSLFWLFCIMTIYLLHKEYEYCSYLRQLYMKMGDASIPRQTYYSLRLENIPAEFKSDAGLKNYFNYLFPDKVHSAKILFKLPECESLSKIRMDIVRKYEKAVASYEASGRKKTPTVYVANMVGGKADAGGSKLKKRKKMDAIPYYESELQRLNEALTKLRKDSSSVADAEAFSQAGNEHFARVGFVTFSSFRALSAAVSAKVLSLEYPNMRAYPAPALTDIVWRNASVSNRRSRRASFVTLASLVLLFIAWVCLCCFIGALSNIEVLRTYITSLENIDDTTYTVLAMLIPVILLVSALVVLDVLFREMLTRLERRKLRSEIQMVAMRW